MRDKGRKIKKKGHRHTQSPDIFTVKTGNFIMFYAARGAAKRKLMLDLHVKKIKNKHLFRGDCDGGTMREQCLTQRFNICDIKEIK